MTTALGEHEILTAVEIVRRKPGQGWRTRSSSHPASRYAVVGAAAVVTVTAACARRRSVAIGGLVPSRRAAPAVEKALAGARPDRDDDRGRCRARLPKDWAATSLGDIFASAEYRRAMAAVYVKRALTAAVRTSGVTCGVPASVDELERMLAGQRYVADRASSMSVYLALKLRRPLFLEGEAGVGKTEVAKALAAALRHRADSPAVLRGLDVSARALRMELPAAAARDPPARGQPRARSRFARPSGCSPSRF